jgi:uncharacterized protein YkwD
MRIINTLIFLITFISLKSQTDLDFKVFEKVNDWRIENNIEPLTWCDKAYQVAKNQSTFNRLTKSISHNQFQHDSIGDFIIEDKFEKKFHNKEIKAMMYGENIARILSFGTGSIDSLSTHVVELWKGSYGHNLMMLMGEVQFGAIAFDYSYFESYVSVNPITMDVVDYNIYDNYYFVLSLYGYYDIEKHDEIVKYIEDLDKKHTQVKMDMFGITK